MRWHFSQSASSFASNYLRCRAILETMTQTQAMQIAGAKGTRVQQLAAQERAKRVLALHTAGMSQVEIAKNLAVSVRTVQRDLYSADEALVDIKRCIEDSGIDADDLRMRFTSELDADVAQLFDEQGQVKPVSHWPQVFRTGLVAGLEVESEDIYERSKDGGQASWDKTGAKKTTVKIKLADRTKIAELAGKLKSVDAFVKQGGAEVHLHDHLHLEVEAKLNRAREIASLERERVE